MRGLQPCGYYSRSAVPYPLPRGKMSRTRKKLVAISDRGFLCYFLTLSAAKIWGESPKVTYRRYSLWRVSNLGAFLPIGGERRVTTPWR